MLKYTYIFMWVVINRKNSDNKFHFIQTINCKAGQTVALFKYSNPFVGYPRKADHFWPWATDNKLLSFDTIRYNSAIEYYYFIT